VAAAVSGKREPQGDSCTATAAAAAAAAANDATACRLMPAAAAAAAAASHVFPLQCEYSRSIEISDLPKRCFNSLAKLVSKRERKNWTDFQQVYAAMTSYSPAS